VCLPVSDWRSQRPEYRYSSSWSWHTPCCQRAIGGHIATGELGCLAAGDRGERGFVVLLASLLPHWHNALLLVKPETVLRWHREGFGIRVSKRTIQRHISKARPLELPCVQTWRTFLKNHTVWACHFLLAYDIWFRPIFAFFVIDINSKRVVHIGVTRSPTAEWTAQ